MCAAVAVMRTSKTTRHVSSMLLAWHAWATRAGSLERSLALQLLFRYQGAAFAVWRDAAVRRRIKRLQCDMAQRFAARRTGVKVLELSFVM